MVRRLAQIVFAVGLGLALIGGLAVLPGGAPISEKPRAMMGSGFVND